MFSIVAENLQPFDKRAREALSMNEDALLAFIKEIEQHKATHIDVNLGHLRKGKEKIVNFFIENIEKLSSLKILIDSTDPEVIEIAINKSSKGVIINGFSMEEKKLKHILPLATKYNCDIVGFVMSDGYIPKSVDEKLALAEGLILEAENSGLKKSKIILDPVIAPLGWSDGAQQNKANIEFIKLVPQIFGEDLRTICGLSNLTTHVASGVEGGFIQSNYLSMLYGAGISMVMLDIFKSELQNSLKMIEILENKKIFSFYEFIS